MDKVNGNAIGFTGGTVVVKRSVKKYAPKQIRDAICSTAENVAEIADKNGVNITYSMRTRYGKPSVAPSKNLYVYVERSNGIFKRLLSGSLKGYGEYRNPSVVGNFDHSAFIANVREIVSRFKTKSYENVGKTIIESL